MKPVLEDEQIIVDGQTNRQTDRQHIKVRKWTSE
jgi:hypothetical protein